MLRIKHAHRGPGHKLPVRSRKLLYTRRRWWLANTRTCQQTHALVYLREGTQRHKDWTAALFYSTRTRILLSMPSKLLTPQYHDGNTFRCKTESVPTNCNVYGRNTTTIPQNTYLSGRRGYKQNAAISLHEKKWETGELKTRIHERSYELSITLLAESKSAFSRTVDIWSIFYK